MGWTHLLAAAPRHGQPMHSLGLGSALGVLGRLGGGVVGHGYGLRRADGDGLPATRRERRPRWTSAPAPVLGPPPQDLAGLDELAQVGDGVDERLGRGRAARRVDVDRHDLVDALHDGVVVEHAAARGAHAHGDDPLRVGHLVVDLAQHRRHLLADPTGHDHDVGLTGRGPEDLHAEAGQVVVRGARTHHLDGAARQPERDAPRGAGPGPLHDVLEPGGEALWSRPATPSSAKVAPDAWHTSCRLAHAAVSSLGSSCGPRGRPAGRWCVVVRSGDTIAVSRRARLDRPPVEPALGHHVHEREEEDDAEGHDLPEAVGAERAVRHRVRVEEHDLDVEHDEQHRHEVEAHREALRAAPSRARCRTRTAPTWRRWAALRLSSCDVDEADAEANSDCRARAQHHERRAYWPIARPRPRRAPRAPRPWPAPSCRCRWASTSFSRRWRRKQGTSEDDGPSRW